jgi:hypothetical protein
LTPIDQQIQQLVDLSARHYPEDEAKRNACLVRLLTQRLTEFAALYQRLPVRQMREAEK